MIEYAPGCLPSIKMLPQADSAVSSACEPGAKLPTPSERERTLMALVVSEKGISGGPSPKQVNPVNPERSAAARKAWETLPKNRQLKAKA